METEKNLMIVDNVTLEVGKEYFVQYKHGQSDWNKIKITRITDMGHPWQSGYRTDGIITDGNYNVRELTNEYELEHFARKWLIDNAGINTNRTLPELLAKFYNSYIPNSIDSIDLKK